MRHRKSGRKLGRTGAHRRALMTNLATSLFDKERITTTLPKAKELRSYAERLITTAKGDSLHARRLVARHVHDKLVLRKIFDKLSPRFADRPGGYTRIYKLGYRAGDSAEMAVIELLDRPDGEAPAASGGSRRLVERDEPADSGKASSEDDSASKSKGD